MSEFIHARRTGADTVEVSVPHVLQLQSAPRVEFNGYLRVHLNNAEVIALIEQLQVAELYAATDRRA